MKNVLFICKENSCRSQMAEAFANMHGRNIIKACSSGSRPSGIVNPNAIKSMQEVGYDLSVHQSKGLGDIPQIEYDLVVSMGCGDECPAISAKERIDWDIPDPRDMDQENFANVRDQIRENVLELLKKI